MGIELRNVSKTYASKADEEGSIRALDGVTLAVEDGEWLAVMGPSGSGKSTLVNLIGCLDRPSAGQILIAGQDLSGLSRRQLDRFRSEKIGFIFQQYHLIPYLTALENVMLAQYFHSMTDEAQALAQLERVGLRDRAGHLPGHLSGGEQQRVCIARALINDPGILLADEPTGNLDAQNEHIVLRLLRQLHDQGRTIVMVTHDPVVARLADRRIELHHGSITQQETFAFSDEQQFDEVLEELWTLLENGERPELGRLQVSGALPVEVAVERMSRMGLLELREHIQTPHTHKEVVDRCHDVIHPPEGSGIPAHGRKMIEFTARGRQRAADVIRRHRLAERLFTEALNIQDEAEVEEQACKFEHILSAEATDKICSFLGHPETCPHGSPIPPGPCCERKAAIKSGL